MSNMFSNDGAVIFSWRSSKWFVLSTIAIALFAETFLYGFLVPILPYMLRVRLHANQAELQELTSLVLAIHGIVSVFSGPIIGHFADKTSSRRLPLLLSLGACIVGTGMVACSTSLAVLFAGRVMQGIAGSSVWIVGLATVADTVGRNDMGKVEGIMMSFLYTGMIGGPFISGLLLEYAGYWLTWSLPLFLLGLDFIARLLMIETRVVETFVRGQETTSKTAQDSRPLLASSTTSQACTAEGNFWRIILCDARVLTALFVSVSTTTIGTSFHATLPIYVQEAFGWGSGKCGSLFACLIMPTLVFSPLAGWLRDRFGVLYPSMGSAVFQAAMLGLLGLAGTDFLPWTTPEASGGVLMTVCILAIGAARPFTMNVGPVELSTIVKAYQERFPGIFGPEGGMSRVFSLDDVAASLGTVLGPLIGGFLKKNLGFAYMCWTWSILCILIAILVACFLGGDYVSQPQPYDGITRQDV